MWLLHSSHQSSKFTIPTAFPFIYHGSYLGPRKKTDLFTGYGFDKSRLSVLYSTFFFKLFANSLHLNVFQYLPTYFLGLLRFSSCPITWFVKRKMLQVFFSQFYLPCVCKTLALVFKILFWLVSLVLLAESCKANFHLHRNINSI